MKIGIDIRSLIEGKRTGVEEYVYGMLHNLFAQDTANEYVLFLNCRRAPKFDLAEFAAYPNVTLKRFKYPNKLLNLLFWYGGWPHVDKLLGGVDVFFMPNLNFIGLSKKCKLILTVHDLSYEICPWTFSPWRRFWHFMINPKKLAHRADKIVAVSDSTAQDVQRIFHVEPEKIVRIYNGAAENLQKIDRNNPHLLKVMQKYKLPYKFILFLGTIEPRKNILQLLEAFELLKDSSQRHFGQYKLVLAGGKGWQTQEIMERLRSSKYTADIVYTDLLTNEDKPYLLNLASVFVYPSFLEGFGLPVLEALKCEVPVICANTAALPEVAGSAAVLVDPQRPNDLFFALREVLLSKQLQETLSERGRWQAFRFSWKMASREFLQLLKKVGE